MSRNVTLALIGGILLVLALVVGTAVVMILPGYLTISGQSTAVMTPIPVVEVTIPPGSTATMTGIPVSTATPTAVPGGATLPPATTVTQPTTAATLPPATAVQPTAVVVFNTPVQFVMAKTDLNMRAGPGTTYVVVGWVAGGQIAKVTGISADGGWWRVVCPDNTVGNCWISANANFSQPTTDPGSSPTATSAPAACTDRAALVADVTVPDGSIFAPNTGFNKTWRLQNTGTCSWDTRYKLVHAGGHLLGAISTSFPLPHSVPPGGTIDLTVSLVSPATADTYQGDWKLQNPQGQFFGVGRSGSPFWVNIVVSAGQRTTISGVIYDDRNQNGVYDSGEPTIGGREVQLVPGTACQVIQDAVATARSGGDGRYTLSGDFSGSYCVGLAGSAGLDDVVGVAVTPGQALFGINLHTSPSSGSISGWLWDDYCLTNESGDALDGSCVADGNGDYHADGMIQPSEGYIAGVTMLLQAGNCATDNPVAVTASTDSGGRYSFSSLAPGTYCVLMNAASPENAPRLLPGDWTFPARGIWYQEITLQAGENVTPVNFGWDYQLQ